jgi:hypothetical protein
MDEVYIYQKFDPVSNQFSPQWSQIDAESAILNGSAIKVQLESVPQFILSELFETPILNFIIEKDFKDAVGNLSIEYFDGKFLDELLFFIINIQAKYRLLFEPLVYSKVKLIEDYAKINKDRSTLINALTKFIEKYKMGQQNKGGTIQELSLTFNDEVFKIKNFLVIDDILSTYLAYYDFKFENPSEWKSKVENALPRFDVNMLSTVFRKKLCISFFDWYSNLLGKKHVKTIPNKFLKPLNIIFSLASISVNDSTIFYGKKINFRDYYSTAQIKVLNTWISRNNTSN